MKYLDFSIKVQPKQGEAYPVFVLKHPVSDSAVSSWLTLPFAPEEMGTLLADLGLSVRGAGDGAARHLMPSPTGPCVSAEELGSRLFEALFSGNVRSVLDRSLGKIQGKGVGLRIKIHIDPEDPSLAQLAGLPWELLYRQETREWLSLRDTPIVRYLDVQQPHMPLKLHPPLRVLVVRSQPADYSPLNLSEERALIERGWAMLQGEGVEVEELGTASLEALHDRLTRKEYHVLHYMGHGGFDEHSGRGVLVMEGEDGVGHQVDGPTLGELLRKMRLVVLNACETARITGEEGQDPFAGVATSLVMAGIPAVVAMQFPISDAAAIAFCRSFYVLLARGEPVDTAVTEGRRAIFFSQPGTLEWGTPVLFMRVSDGVIFQVTRTARPDRKAEQADEEAANRAAQEAAAAKAAREQAERDAAEEARHKAAQEEAAPKAAQEQAERRAADAPRLLATEKARRTDSATVPASKTQTVRTGVEIFCEDVFMGTGARWFCTVKAGYEASYRLKQKGWTFVPLQPDVVATIVLVVRPLIGPESGRVWDVFTLQVGEVRKYIYQPSPYKSLSFLRRDEQGEREAAQEARARPASGLLIATPQNLAELLVQSEPPARVWWEKAEMELCLVPAGEFLMGSTERDRHAIANEKPQHRVYLDAYYVGRFPATLAQYAPFVQDTGYRPPSALLGGRHDWDKKHAAPGQGKQSQPVVHVSWHDAMAYCAWAGLRLPTEAEWEKAARGTDGRIYPWGDAWDAARCNLPAKGKGDTTPVWAYSPMGDSPYGCGDMVGNVAEWCADWYDEGYYDVFSPRNPSGPESGTVRVLRGGSWRSQSVQMRSAYRGSQTPDSRNGEIGFRCVVSSRPSP